MIYKIANILPYLGICKVIMFYILIWMLLLYSKYKETLSRFTENLFSHTLPANVNQHQNCIKEVPNFQIKNILSNNVPTLLWRVY